MKKFLSLWKIKKFPFERRFMLATLIFFNFYVYFTCKILQYELYSACEYNEGEVYVPQNTPFTAKKLAFKPECRVRCNFINILQY